MRGGDGTSLASTGSAIEAVLKESDVRIVGTEIFNYVLIVLICILLILAVIVVKKSIANPAKHASVQLNDIVQKIEDNHGDLTERIQTKFVDEIGQLVQGVNGFMDQLQSLMKQMQEQAMQLGSSVDQVTGQAAVMTQTMEAMERGIGDIATTVDESAKGVSCVAEETSQLVSALSLIQEATADNQAISRKLEEEVNRFEKV